MIEDFGIALRGKELLFEYLVLYLGLLWVAV